MNFVRYCGAWGRRMQYHSPPSSSSFSPLGSMVNQRVYSSSLFLQTSQANQTKFEDQTSRRLTYGVLLVAGVTFIVKYQNDEQKIFAEEMPATPLPTYRREEIAQHKTSEKGIWVTYKGVVYDITTFVEEHPGGKERILMAAGGDIEV
jgi:cytochrome b involved in lipid metabolism